MKPATDTARADGEERDSTAFPLRLPELKKGETELTSLEPYNPSCSQVNTCSQEKQWNIPEILHHLETRQEINAMLREQACFHKHEIRFPRAQEFQGRQTIRSDDDLVATLLCQSLPKL